MSGREYATISKSFIGRHPPPFPARIPSRLPPANQCVTGVPETVARATHPVGIVSKY